MGWPPGPVARQFGSSVFPFDRIQLFFEGQPPCILFAAFYGFSYVTGQFTATTTTAEKRVGVLLALSDPLGEG